MNNEQELNNLIEMFKLMGQSLPHNFATHESMIISKLTSVGWGKNESSESAFLLSDTIISSFKSSGLPPPSSLVQYLNSTTIDRDHTPPKVDLVELLIRMYDVTKRETYFELVMLMLIKIPSTQSMIDRLFQSHPTEIKLFFTKESNIDKMATMAINLSLVINCIVQSFVPDHLVPLIIGKSSPSYTRCDSNVVFTSTCKDQSRASIMFIDIMFDGYHGEMKWGTDKLHSYFNNVNMDYVSILVKNVQEVGHCGPAYHLLRYLYSLQHICIGYKDVKLKLRSITHNMDNEDECAKQRQLFKEFKQQSLFNNQPKKKKVTKRVNESLPALPPLVINHIVSMAIRFGFNNDTGLSQRWLISLALVNSQFHKTCTWTLTNFAIPSLSIGQDIPTTSTYGLFQKTPLHLRSTEIKHVPQRKGSLCASRLMSLTVPFSKGVCWAARGSFPNLKAINFIQLDAIPKQQNGIYKRDPIVVERMHLESLNAPTLFSQLLGTLVNGRHGLQSISVTTSALDNPFDYLPLQQSSTINLKCHVDRLNLGQLTSSETTTSTMSLSHITSIKVVSKDIPLLYRMTNLSSLHLQFNQPVPDNGMIDRLQEFYAGTLTLNTLVLHMSSVNVIHLLPHCQTTPITSLTLAFTDIDRLAMLNVKGKLHQLFDTMATHLQQTMIKQLEYLSIYMTNQSNIIIPFNIQCLSPLITDLQLHYINPINFYRLLVD
ncbi:hypothetical protein SAMD00019534_116730 [Acytostelium subglobosum LB1]|uniref:hypothetical protein n=1 Tax=Acytostelium subglobosum LB1 TaxID=1410327 RepID=UPI0006449FBF|nr:hypothetical protein SAMD00019534_116730 [Acytostelium subglobosum LB1]GAM28497.1 hypothetical protein SAMD00019534_116730 [Acytostelium subglobosum LB1]|eukprot:XP_012748536.1 hypothetical protein SAMD00019534_116730 [Acytostelium subglobosum LB1]